MLYFSYNDFMDCMENKEKNKVTELQENVETYQIKNGINIQEHKNQIIEGLKKENEIYKMQEDFFKNVELQNSENLIYCNTINVKADLKNYENVTYKVKGKEIFIFMKVIDKIDVNISYKIFEHSLEIINKWASRENLKNRRKPIVIPIVIYIGNETWKNKNRRKYENMNYITYIDNRIKFSYNIIDINEFKVEELNKMKSNLAKQFIKIKNKYLQIN